MHAPGLIYAVGELAHVGDETLGTEPSGDLVGLVPRGQGDEEIDFDGAERISAAASQTLDELAVPVVFANLADATDLIKNPP